MDFDSALRSLSSTDDANRIKGDLFEELVGQYLQIHLGFAKERGLSVSSRIPSSQVLATSGDIVHEDEDIYGDGVNLLRQIELGLASGRSVATACRSAGISDATYYNWRKKYGGMGKSQLQELKGLGCSAGVSLVPADGRQVGRWLGADARHSQKSTATTPIR